MAERDADGAGAVRELGHVLAYEPESVRCPYAAYAAVREAGPAVWVPEIEAFVVARFDDIATVNRRPQVFSSSAAIGPRPVPVLLQELFNERRRREGRTTRPVQPPAPVLLTADPPLHTRHRSLLGRAFSPRRVSALEDRITALCEELVGAVAPRGCCEFVADVAVPLPLTVLAEVLGIDSRDLPAFKRWSDDFTSVFGTAEPSEDRLMELAATAFEFEEYFRARVDERRAAPRDDLLSDVVGAHEGAEDPLTNDEIVTMFAQVLVAGNETTTKMLTYAAHALATDSGLADRLRARPDLVPGFVEEILRLESPIQGFWRVATTDADVGGVAIPAGAQLLLLYGSGNRDPSAFPDPDELVVERDAARPHLAFGVGAHYCLGAQLARAEGRILTETMVRDLADLALDPAEELVPEPSYLLHGLAALHLRFTRRDPDALDEEVPDR